MRSDSWRNDPDHIRRAEGGKSDEGARKKDKKFRHDPDYIRYVESGESAAVFVVRDVAENINTRGRWVDIVSLSAHLQD